MPYLPPSPPPEGIDLVIQKALIDDDVIRRNRELQREEREARSDLARSADELAALADVERDHLGRVVVDWRYALVGAVILAIFIGLAFYVVQSFLTVASPP